MLRVDLFQSTPHPKKKDCFGKFDVISKVSLSQKTRLGYMPNKMAFFTFSMDDFTIHIWLPIHVDLGFMVSR